MTNDDFIDGLTQEVKEEVVRNYLYERRLLEEQANYVHELADVAKTAQDNLSKRFARIYDFLIESDFIGRFLDLVGLQSRPFEKGFSKKAPYGTGIRFIKVTALTDRAKYKKLLVESYRRLFVWNEKYSKAYLELQEESQAVNHNLKNFEKNYDILTILRFLKNMDVDGVEKKYFLGENFSAKEMASVEKNLRFKSFRMEQFGLVEPMKLPPPVKIKNALQDLADCVFGQCKTDVKKFMR